MMLFLDGTYRGIHCENVNYWIPDYGSAFELLTQLVADHWTLEYALIVDNGDCMAVPVEAFDGQPIQVHIDTLEREWKQALLAKPTRPNQFSTANLKYWFLQLDTYYNSLLAHFEKMIFLLENRKLMLITKRNNEELKRRLSIKYDLLLESNRKLHQQTKKDRQKNHQRLQVLADS